MKRSLIILWTYLASTVVNAQTVVQMSQKNGVYIVNGKVDGIPMNFVFDTGASDVSISLLEATFLLKQGKLTRGDIIGYANYSDANGEIRTGMKIYLREFELGGLVLTNVEASVVGTMDAPLLLGGSAMNRLGKYAIDPSNSTLTIYGGGSQTTHSVATDYYSLVAGRQGDALVNTYASILDRPDMCKGRTIGAAEESTVTIIRQENERYYYIRSGATTGYLWAGWLK